MKRCFFFLLVLIFLGFGTNACLFARSDEFIRKPDRGVEVKIVGDERGILNFHDSEFAAPPY
jgi:hypothetical protein